MQKYTETYRCTICDKEHPVPCQAAQCFDSHDIRCLLCGEEIEVHDCFIHGGSCKVEFGYGSCHDGDSTTLFFCDICWKVLGGYQSGTPIVSEFFQNFRKEIKGEN